MIITKLLLFSFIYLFFILIIEWSSSVFINDDNYIKSIKLENTNILIITHRRIYLVNSDLSKIIKQTDYQDIPFCHDITKIISFSKEDGGYILFCSCDDCIIISKEGNIISNRIREINHIVGTVIPYGHDENNSFFYNIYFLNNNINFKKYSYNSLLNEVKENKTFSTEINNRNEDYNYITCQKMEYLQKNVFSCFIQTIYNNKTYINLTFFDIQNDFSIIKNVSIQCDSNFILVYPISTIMKEKEKQKILAIYLSNDGYFHYIGYENNNDKLILKRLYINNLDHFYFVETFSLSFFYETEEFVFSFISHIYQREYSLCFFDKEFNIIFTGFVECHFYIIENCNKIDTIFEYINSRDDDTSVFFSSIAQRYYLIGYDSIKGSINLFYLNYIKKIKLYDNNNISSIYLICENYDNYFNSECNSLSNINNYYKNNITLIEKCSSEIEYITSFVPSYNFSIIEIIPIIETIPISETIQIIETTQIIKSTLIIETTHFIKTTLISETDFIIESTHINEKIPFTKTIQIIIPTTDLSFISEDISNTYSYEIISTYINNKICNIESIINGTCLKNDNNNESEDINILDIIKNSFTDGSMNLLFEDIINGEKENIIINDNKNNIIYEIISSNGQNNDKNKRKNISTINLGECENILKDKYNINKNESLLILKADAYIPNSLIPVIQYEVYHPENKSKLNLNFCNKTKIDLKIPVSINEDEVYKYEPDSDYYNDICFSTTSKNGTDISIKDRQNEFVNDNLALCEDKCDYVGYDNEEKKANCKCKVKNEIKIINIEIEIDKEHLYDKFTMKNITNIGIIKCYYLLFKKDGSGLKYNIGNYILLFIFFICIIDMIIFIFKGYKYILNIINLILKIKNTNDNKVKKNNILTTNDNITKIKNKNAKIKNKIKGNIKINFNIKQEQIIKNKKKGKKKSLSFPPKKKLNKKKFNSYIKRNKNINLNNESSSTYKFRTGNNLNSLKINDNNKDIKTIKKLNTKKKKKMNKRKLINNNNNIKLKKYTDYEINNFEYKIALIQDKRTYFEYYWSLLKSKHLFLFSFIPNNDYNSTIIKISLFFFSFALYYTINALFYTDNTMHDIYLHKGKYNFIYQIPKIIYSNLISTVINTLMYYLSLSEKTIIQIKNQNYNNNGTKLHELKKFLLIKFIIYYILYYIFLLFFWFYVSCFCVVYKNTQLYLIKDTLISFSLSLIYPLGYYLLPGILRIPALRVEKKNKECLYKVSKIIQII